VDIAYADSSQDVTFRFKLLGPQRIGLNDLSADSPGETRYHLEHHLLSLDGHTAGLKVQGWFTLEFLSNWQYASGLFCTVSQLYTQYSHGQSQRHR